MAMNNFGPNSVNSQQDQLKSHQNESPWQTTSKNTAPGAGTSGILNSSNNNFMIGHDDDSLLRCKNDGRIPVSTSNFINPDDSQGIHPGLFVKHPYPGLEHFKVPMAVAETALKVQQSQPRLGYNVSDIPDTVAIFALNLTGTNIPGTCRLKRVVHQDNEMRANIANGELYSKHDSVVIEILTNQVHVPQFNIADYLSRDKFPQHEMEKIENIHSRIDPYQLICLMEFIRYRYPHRSKSQTSDHNKPQLPQSAVDPSSDFRSNLSQRDLISNVQQISAHRGSNVVFSPMPGGLESGISHFDKSIRSSQSPSYIPRSRININAQRPQVAHSVLGHPNFPNPPHPMSSTVNNSLISLPYSPQSQPQKSPMNRSSPFQPPLLVNTHSIVRPPRSQSTFGALGVSDAPLPMNSSVHLRQPPAAHLNSSRINLPIVDSTPAPAHCFNTPPAAHMSSKTPLTPRMHENHGRPNLKSAHQEPTYAPKAINKLPSTSQLDQLSVPTKTEFENNHGLPLNTLLGFRQQEIANRDLAMRRSMNSHYTPQGMTGGPMAHSTVVGSRTFEMPVRGEFAPRSPSHPPINQYSNSDIFRASTGSNAFAMPPPSTYQPRMYEMNKHPLITAPSLTINSSTHNDSQFRQSSSLMSAFQNQQLNLITDKPMNIQASSNLNQLQHSPGQISTINPISLGAPELAQTSLSQQKPPATSPKQSNQRSIITGSASPGSKRGKKSSMSSPTNNQSNENKASIAAICNSDHHTPEESIIIPGGNQKMSILPTTDTVLNQRAGQAPDSLNEVSKPTDELSKLAAAAAAAAPAINVHPKADLGVSVGSASLNARISPMREFDDEAAPRGAKNIAQSGQICSLPAQLKKPNFSANGNGISSVLGNKIQEPQVDSCSKTSEGPEKLNLQTQSEEPSKYQKLFTKKAWLKNYDQEDQAKRLEDAANEKMAIESVAENSKESSQAQGGDSLDSNLKTAQVTVKSSGNNKNKSTKNDSKKKGKVKRCKSGSLTSLNTSRLASADSIENDSEETTASTSDLDDTTDETDSLKSSGDKVVRRMPGRKAKIYPERDSSQSSKPKSPKEASRKRAKEKSTSTNDSDPNSNSIVKRRYNSDDESAKQKSKKIKDNNGKVWDKSVESLSKSKKRSGKKFLQTCPCYDIVPKNIRCMECRRVRQSSLKGDKVIPSKQTSRTNWDDFCRFYEFRKLRYNKADQIVVAGFSDMSDAKDSDKQLWLPNSSEVPNNFNYNVAKFILTNVGTEFCNLVQQERAVQNEYESRSNDKKITWKRAVNGLRELCDVCSTTLFNCHFVCEQCGFVVCIDCHKHRAKQQSNIKDADQVDIKKEGSLSNENPDEQAGNHSNKKSKKDSSGWMYCAKNEEHNADKMILAQIIAGDCLEEVWNLLHQTRTKLNLGQCQCKKDFSEDAKNFTELDVPRSTGDRDSDSEGSHSTLKGLLLAQSPSANTNISNNGDEKTLHISDTIENCTSSKLTASGGKEFDFINEDDSQDDSRQVTAAIEECIASLSTKGFDEQQSPEDIPDAVSDRTKEAVFTNLCDGDLLVLNQPRHKDNVKLFRDHWQRGEPVLVRGVDKLMSIQHWLPQFFALQFGDYRSDLVDCRNGDIHRQSMKKYWDGFEPNINSSKKKNKDDNVSSHMPSASNEEPSAITTTYYCGSALWRLKDWPPGQDFYEILPDHYNDFMTNLPLKPYTTRTGKLNLACRLPKEMLKPDLGPKMYSAYGTTKFPERGTTNLHLDICDAVNVMVYVGGATSYQSGSPEYREMFEKTLDEANVDVSMKSEIRRKGLIPGALWHIFKPSDASKMRDFLNKVADERKISPEKRTDPIHDQIWYLDQNLLDRLQKECGVKSYSILQCMGDAILIPAGAPHQVKNLQNCIKVANDFVSPENVHWCLKLTDEFRKLPETHINQEDKLQIKNILYHCVKESLQYIRMHDLGKVNAKTSETDDGSGDETDADKTESESDSNGKVDAEETDIKNIE